MQILRFCGLLTLLLTLSYCQDASQAGSSEPVETVTVDETEYETSPVAGSSAQLAIKRDLLGGVAETGS